MKNWLLSLAVVAALYTALELLALPIFHYFLPPLAHPLLDDGLPVLLQGTRHKFTPEHYIGLAGDSYAMGLGDGYYHTANTAQAKYGSAPYIQENTNRDVISFGSAGNGSIAGMVTEPLSTLAYWQASWRTSLTSPDTLLVYFYEGNDLNDNVEYLQKAGKKRLAFDYTQIHNSDYFQTYIQEVALNQDSLYRQSQQLGWYDQLYLGKFVFRSALALAVQIPKIFHADKPAATTRSPLNPPGRFEWTEPGTINRAIIDHAEVQLPDQLQGPSMDLTAHEKEIALISFREALRFLKTHLPNTRIVMIYIPSVITAYDISSPQVNVQSHTHRTQFVYATAAVKQQGEWIANQIQAISHEEQVTFIDTRPAIHDASQKLLLHGPLDWNHFNQEGYYTLAKAIIANL